MTFTDVRQAGDHLAAVLAKGPPQLLVLDDVRCEEQLAAFPVAGRCARLVTTRIPAPGAGINVLVDVMSPQQALALLQTGLPPLTAEIATGLVEMTGRVPHLLREVNRTLANHARMGSDISTVAEELWGRRRGAGRC